MNNDFKNKKDFLGKLKIILFISFLASFGMLFLFALVIKNETAKTLGAIFFFLAALLSVIGLVWIRKKERESFEKIDEEEGEFIQKQLNKIFPGSFFNKDVGIGEKTFLSSEFVDWGKGMIASQRPEYTYETNCLIKGKYKNVNFYCSNSRYKAFLRTRKNSNTAHVTLFDGIFMIFDFENDFDEKIKIYEDEKKCIRTGSELYFDHYYHAMGGYELKKVETESIQMSKKFECRTSDEKTFFKVVTPSVIGLILAIEEEYPGYVHFSFKQGKCYVGLWSPQKTFGKCDYHQIARNIALIKEIIEGFNLSGSIFTSAESRYKSISEVVNEKNKIEKEVNENLNSWGRGRGNSWN